MNAETTALEIVADDEDRRLKIRWGDGHESRFPYVWLRHELQMGAFPGGIPRGELDSPVVDPADVTLLDIYHQEDGLILTWGPGASETRHGLAELRRRCLSTEARAARRHRPVPWNAPKAETLPWIEWSDLSSRDDTRLAFYLSLLDYGVARIAGLPPVSGAIEDLAGLLGPIHETGYGRLFDVRSDSKIQLGATTAKALGPHTDENYRHAPPGITVFHCIKAHPAGGGLSTLVDGFEVAHRLQLRNPEAFALLSETPLEFCDSSAVDDYRAYGRVITRDRHGEVVGIRYTDRTIAPLDVDEHMMEPAYQALSTFAEILREPDLTYRHLLQPGEVHVFDNQRVLHGRTEFDPDAGPRHLQQCAVDRDEFHHRLRMLARRMDHPVANQTFAHGALA